VCVSVRGSNFSKRKREARMKPHEVLREKLQHALELSELWAKTTRPALRSALAGCSVPLKEAIKALDEMEADAPTVATR
jgi:hypothetical protein